MALDLSSIFGSAPDYSAVLSPEQSQQMQQNAIAQGGIGALIALLGASGKQTNAPSTGQALAGALGAGYGGYQSSFDTTLKQMLAAQQLGEYKQKQEARQKYEKAIAGATTQTPQAIPMATGQGSQLEMLNRPEFGGGMAEAETIGALRGNLPMTEKVDATAANRAAMDYLRQVDPAKFIELTATKNTAPASVKEYQFAVSQGYKGSFQEYNMDQLKAKASVSNITNIIPTEGERKAGTLANILDKNIAQLQAAVGKDPTAVKPNVAASVVKGITGSDYLARELTPDQRQVVEASQLDILDAALTLRTGAAYTREQLNGYRESYFPQLGDKPDQIKQKQIRLENLLDSAFMASGRAAPSRTVGKGENAGTTAIKPAYTWNPKTQQLEPTK